MSNRGDKGNVEDFIVRGHRSGHIAFKGLTTAQAYVRAFNEPEMVGAFGV